MEQLNLFGKIIYWKDWTKYFVESLDGVRLANFDDIPECETCKLDTVEHPLLYRGNDTYALLCTLDVLKLKLIKLPKREQNLRKK